MTEEPRLRALLLRLSRTRYKWPRQSAVQQLRPRDKPCAPYPLDRSRQRNSAQLRSTRFRVYAVSESAGNPEMCTAWERPSMENPVSYRSICRGGSWLDMVRGEAENENDTRATTDLIRTPQAHQAAAKSTIQQNQ